MEPMALLMSEHRVIQSVLDALVAEGAAVSHGGAVDPARLRDFVTFLRGYADAIHHGKEESILFAFLRHGSTPVHVTALISANCRDHETARLLTSDLGAHSRRASWTARDRGDLVRVVNEYASLLRRHIADEDRSLFPALAAALGPEGMHRVAAAFERFEREHDQQRDELLALASRLAGPE